MAPFDYFKIFVGDLHASKQPCMQGADVHLVQCIGQAWRYAERKALKEGLQPGAGAHSPSGVMTSY